MSVNVREYHIQRYNIFCNRSLFLDAANQTSSTAASTDSLSNFSNSGLSNQALYGYQAASSPYTYQSQNQVPYADQQKDSQGYTPGYKAYYDNAAYQENGASQAQNTAQQSDSQGYTSSNSPGYNGYYDNTAYQENGVSQAQNAAQQSDSQGYTSSNTSGYNAYYDSTANQENWASQAQSTAGQKNYYSDQQQYQTPSDQGSYFSG